MGLRGCVEMRTGEVGDPVRVAVSREDDDVADGVVLYVAEYALTVCAISVPCVLTVRVR